MVWLSLVSVPKSKQLCSLKWTVQERCIHAICMEAYRKGISPSLEGGRSLWLTLPMKQLIKILSTKKEKRVVHEKQKTETYK